jgi:hypothetical protein
MGGSVTDILFSDNDIIEQHEASGKEFVRGRITRTAACADDVGDNR